MRRVFNSSLWVLIGQEIVICVHSSETKILRLAVQVSQCLRQEISVFATVVHRISLFVSAAQWVSVFASVVHKDSVSASSVQRIQLFVDFFPVNFF